MNCDWIAPYYELFERAAFGGRLQRHRVAYLDAAADKRKALVLGDGDGRFTQELARAYPELYIDCVEMSAGMVREARKRVGLRVNLIQRDVFDLALTPEAYDVVFTHFFLDCFDVNQLASLMARVSRGLTRDAVWIVSDFRNAERGWRKLFTGIWLKTMYLFFRLTTGLQISGLPGHGAALESAGFHLCKEQVSLLGLVASEWWQR